METQMMCMVDVRPRRRRNIDIPTGYYGNALAFPVAVATFRELCANPVSYAVELVKRAKEQVDMEYTRSVAGLKVRYGQPPFSYAVTDETKAGFAGLDFGWGAPVYGGPAISGIWGSFFLPSKSAAGKGEDGIMATMCLPAVLMDKFVEEMGKLLRPAVVIKSAM
ncbi:benzyl alcohol O-benzoyltransferase-like [Brachypodium distachyon]|uniref:benzyl alcohol O-benzoyltransferase-like n=1 Tax=Brachypodium distachyon TaxID=15368 RepID=UPI00052FDBDF|nr:benzyl alcohol O-benzoyltransferase-like [Brachypodium distachyon]|eukprot:XP_010238931.1 benzyl alcohol O-benzoyltransferase-like [Brachypodium distachyon]